MLWTHDFTAPWQTEKWREQMRAALRPNAFLRLIENRWVTSESSFVDMAWWDGCGDPAVHPLLVDKSRRIYVGIDASPNETARPSSAARGTPRRREWISSGVASFSRPNDPLDFERTIEATMLELRDRFYVGESDTDPYQMACGRAAV